MKTVVIDIETIPDQSEFEFEASLLEAPKNYKDKEKIDTYLEKQRKELYKKMALKDSAHISMIGSLSEGEIYAFCNFQNQEIEGIKTFPAGSEKEMMQTFGAFMDTVNEEDILVSFNGYHFDLPKIRLAFARNDLHVPEALDNEHVDIMFEFSKKFSVSKTPYIGLSEVCHRLGIRGKKIKGESYPKMIEEGQYEWAIVYNALDLLKTYNVFLKLTR